MQNYSKFAIELLGQEQVPGLASGIGILTQKDRNIAIVRLNLVVYCEAILGSWFETELIIDSFPESRLTPRISGAALLRPTACAC